MPPAAKSKRVFVVAVYQPDGEGNLMPVLPSWCPFAAGGDRCRVVVHHYRARKTGPCFRLAVVFCSAHLTSCYTLYPKGHFPYGRAQVVSVSTTGMLFLDIKTGSLAWAETYLAAAIDAAKGERWSSESPFDDPRRRRTQGRRLERAGWLLGVHPFHADEVRERIASCLGVPLMRLQTASRAWGATWTTRGLAVTSVLGAIAATASLPTRMLSAGAAGGLWAEPGAGKKAVPRTGNRVLKTPPFSKPGFHEFARFGRSASGVVSGHERIPPSAGPAKLRSAPSLLDSRPGRSTSPCWMPSRGRGARDRRP